MKFSRVLFVDNEGVHTYDPEIHRLRVVKFLAWDDLLIAGGQKTHLALWKAASRHEEIPYINNQSPLVAAGECMEGLMVDWSSYGYDFTTPEKVKPHIYEVLEMKSAYDF